MNFKEWINEDIMQLAFSYEGGKNRIANWLLGHFPQSGRIYFEPFAGRLNSFLAAHQNC